MADAHKDAARIIPKRELMALRADFKSRIFRQIRSKFHALKTKEGFSQKDIALALGIDEGQLSRQLRGEHDLRLETFSDLARGLECRIDVKLIPIVEIERQAELAQKQMDNALTHAAIMNAWFGTSTGTASATSNNVIETAQLGIVVHE